MSPLIGRWRGLVQKPPTALWPVPYAIGLACLLALTPCANAQLIAGDVNGDGVLDAVDVQLLINVALDLWEDADSDVDGDGATDAIDVQLVINAVLGISIDRDGDGLCDARETRLGTDPDEADTDGGRISDGMEILLGTDPLNNVDDKSADELKAFSHLKEVMDRYHKTYDVYTDLGSPGNHFVAPARIGNACSSMDSGWKGNPHSGRTCIRCDFTADTTNWSGWYFLNGVLQGEEAAPSANWGTVADAGVDLTGATTLTFWARGNAGGERVELFAFGVGRNASSGAAIENYPDSSERISLGYVTLTDTWTQYTLDVSTTDLSYVLGGFGWVTNAPQNDEQDIVFYLDDIQYDKPQLESSRFLLSYETLASEEAFDTMFVNAAIMYDNALALLAFTAGGTADELRRARLLADAFVYALSHDRFYDDGRLRDAYQAGDLVLPAGWIPNGRVGTARMAGWYDADETWHEIDFAGTATGNMAWVMIALLAYYDAQGGQEYLDAAVKLGQWIVDNTYDTRGVGGYTGGYEGWEPTSNHPEGQTKSLWKSTEHNIDVYVAFTRLYEATGNEEWLTRACHARDFVENMWYPADGRFLTGTLDDGVTPNISVRPADVNPWGLLALGEPSSYAAGIAWVANNCYIQCDDSFGFDFDDSGSDPSGPDGVWYEGTAQMILGYQMLGEDALAATCLGELARVQSQAANGNGLGIVAASHDGVTTGFDWEYFARLHVGATAWFIFAERAHNPYWSTDTATLPPDSPCG